MSSNSGDLTARARIRDAAVRLFADKGIDATSIREIAQEAGVSSGLLRHHFGSKEGLRDACDEYAMAQVTAIGSRWIELGVLGRISPDILLYQRYLVRSTMDGSPAGNALFDRMIEFGRHWLDSSGLKTDDPVAFIAVLSAMKMSMFILHEQLSRVLGLDVGEPPGWSRMLRASLDIFGQPLVTPELAEQAQDALTRFSNSEE